MVASSSRWPANPDQQVRRLISRRKRVALGRLHSSTRLMHELHFDLVDVVDIILEVERHFHLTIPDEVPVDTVGALMHYVRGHYPVASRA
ncbi:acyl carrier protein [Hymenobacter cellulosilyticus]|uniref:Acyl carrier protein n=1 Tax=Hymenobacter cellulosilyticus TaxID=2932248 RepID=A0A8T9Q3I5_9BACT|nr:acyl carrier protein [Hymenobacter cellulosilyticus]UOQ71605.1 acyl carrier protein [Hymenobacter cellulosilyticus]